MNGIDENILPKITSFTENTNGWIPLYVIPEKFMKKILTIKKQWMLGELTSKDKCKSGNN